MLLSLLWPSIQHTGIPFTQTQHMVEKLGRKKCTKKTVLLNKEFSEACMTNAQTSEEEIETQVDKAKYIKFASIVILEYKISLSPLQFLL